MPGETPIPTPIYRLVHVDSLLTCVSRGALHAPNQTPADALPYRTIHRLDVQQARQVRPVPVGPRGTVHDYVPFYLGPRSVTLYQKFRLFSALPVHVVRCVIPLPSVDRIPVDLVEVIQVVVPGGESCQAMTVRKT